MESYGKVGVISIGGINFKILPCGNFHLHYDLADYKGFYSSCFPENETINIPVNIFIDKTCNVPSRKPDFLDGRTRKIWIDGRNIYVQEKPDSFKTHLWDCEIVPNKSVINVFCGSPLISRKRNSVLVYNPFSYPLDYLAMMHILSYRAGFIMHAAGIIWCDHGFLFPGRSGTGKSTFSRHFAGRSDAACLSDDRMVIRKLKGNKFWMAGTPWLGDAGLCVNTAAKTEFVVFIKKAKRIAIRRLEYKEVLTRLLPALSIPWYDSVLSDMVLETCDNLLHSLKAVELSCLHYIDDIDEVIERILQAF